MKDETDRGRWASPDGVTGEKLPLDRCLEEASDSLESMRALLSLRTTVGRNLRVAIRCLLDAHERIEVEGPSTAARFDLLEAIRLIGVVERELKGIEPTVLRAGVTEIETDPENRRAYRRLAANVQIQLEPEHRAHRQDIAALPLDGLTMNLSRGGMLAKIDQGILRHGRYLIRFLIDIGELTVQVTREPLRVAFLGRDEPRKGLGVLLEAWPAVRHLVPGAELVVMGSRRAARSGVRFLGEVDDGRRDCLCYWYNKLY